MNPREEEMTREENGGRAGEEKELEGALRMECVSWRCRSGRRIVWRWSPGRRHQGLKGKE